MMDLANFGNSVPVTCSLSAPMSVVARLMGAQAVGNRPILDAQARVTGVITLDDLLTVFAQQTDKLAKVIGTEIANPNVTT